MIFTPARLTAFPSYVVFDRSFQQIVTTTGNTPTITGTPNFINDSDLSSSYSITAVSPVGGDGVCVNIDYGKAYWNAQISWKASFTKNNGAGSANWTVDVSADGITWVTLDSGSVATGATATSLISATMLVMRYVRFKVAYDTLNLTTTVYECRLMGCSF